MKITIMQKCLIGILSIFSGVQLIAWPCGFASVQQNGKKIDIVFDVHEEQESATVAEICALPYDAAKTKFHPEEQVFLTALEQVNAAGRADLVWQLCPAQSGRDSTFISSGPLHITKSFVNLNLIFADTVRYLRFRPLFNFRRGAAQIPAIAAGREFFENPLPLASEGLDAIKSNWGQAVLEAFYQLRADTIRDVQEFFGPYIGNSSFPDEDFLFNNNERFGSLALVELLGVLLSSAKDHVIAYVSPWHGEKIVDFLRGNGFAITAERRRSGTGLKMDEDQPIAITPDQLAGCCAPLMNPSSAAIGHSSPDQASSVIEQAAAAVNANESSKDRVFAIVDTNSGAVDQVPGSAQVIEQVLPGGTKIVQPTTATVVAPVTPLAKPAATPVISPAVALTGRKPMVTRSFRLTQEAHSMDNPVTLHLVNHIRKTAAKRVALKRAAQSMKSRRAPARTKRSYVYSHCKKRKVASCKTRVVRKKQVVVSKKCTKRISRCRSKSRN